jgi:hypothetical protein
MNGANNSTTFIDSSQNALAITALADAKISTAQSKFGGSAAYFDGTGDYLTVADNAVNAFGLGDFTIECWVNFSALPGTNLNMGIANVMTSASSATTTMWWLGLENASGTTRLKLGRHGNGLVYAYFNWTPSLNTWYHIAITRSSSSVISMFIDGVSQSVTTSGSNWANNFSATTILAVGYVATALTFNGYIDDFRLTRAARYTASFTPPTAPLSLPGVVTDLTKNRSVGTLVSGPTYSNQSIAFSGTSNYESINNILNVGPTSTFSICAWAKWNTTATSGGARRPAVGISTITNSFEFALGFPYTYSSSKLGIEVGKAGVASQIGYSINSTPTGVWYHLAGVYKNGSCDFYLNGQYQSSITYNGTINTAVTGSGNWLIGTELFNGTTSSNTIGPMDGNVGQTLVYNRSIAANEVLQNYNSTKGRFGL